MENQSEHIYTIRQVIDLTGASEFTLRAWENRYNAFKPFRTPSGRRRYSSEDVLKARMLLKLTEKGHRIGNIANLEIESLQQLSEERSLKSSPQTDPVFEEITRLMLWADQFAWDHIRDFMHDKRNKIPARSYIFNFLLPLLAEVNHQISTSHFTVAQEHILSAFIKEDLMLIKSKKTSKSSSAARMVFATPEGDVHEIGLLMASVLAYISGITTLYLGPNLPARELCEACERFGATHLLLVATVEKSAGAKQDLYELVNFLDRSLSPQTRLWLAGRCAMGLEVSLKREHQLLNNFNILESLINEELK